MSDYTDLTTQFGYNDLIAWQQFDELGENDNYVRSFYANYRRPVLEFISATQVDVENNTGTANQTKIVFPDGTERSVTEDTSAAHKYRRFTITATAEFTFGTEDSGLLTGLSGAGVNIWYAIYAVKSQIDSTKFVLVGNSTLPIQSNVQTLNSVFGANSWIHLGLIAQSSNVIMDFVQTGNRTVFNNSEGAVPQRASNGITFAQGIAHDGFTYTTVYGTGIGEIPNNIGIFDLIISTSYVDPITGSVTATNKDADTFYFREDTEQAIDFGFQYQNMFYVPSVASSVGLAVVITGGLAAGSTGSIISFIDHALGVGFNPLF